VCNFVSASEEVFDCRAGSLRGPSCVIFGARKHRPWWANQGHAQSAAWLGAGYKTANVDLENEKLTFVYVGPRVDGDLPQASKLTIGEAKAGLAANFGISADAIEITIRG